MAGTIKGIVVEIGGDTSGLQKALSKVNSATSSLSKELKGVNSLLKLDPSNTELLSQKQEILAESIEQTSKKLEELRKVQEAATQEGEKVSPENYRNLQREIANTENKLKQLQVQASKWTSAGKSLEEYGDKITKISKKIDNLGTTITTTLTLPILTIGTAAVTTGNDFEAQMSRVQAIAGATQEELEKLTDQAIELGAETSFSASEAAAGMENLASAGFTTNEIIEAMPGLLDLAASSGAELATASEIAASAIRGFGLEATEAGHVADIFAEASARTNAQVEDMGEAMKYVAPVAKTVGLTIEETAAAIGIMSDAGIKGSQAGTTLRSGLVRIVKPTKQVRDAMEELNVEFYNSDGTMKSLTKIIEDLQKSTEGLTDETKNQALAQIFGTEALSGMLALVNKGSDELEDMTKQFKKADGAAERMADTMLDNTAGAVESLTGSLESAGIVIQKALAPSIKDLAKWIQGLVDDFTDLSEEEQQNIIKTVALVAAIGPAIKILSKLGSGIGTVTKGIGLFSQAIAVSQAKTTSNITSVNNLAKAFSLLSTPMGLMTTVAVAGTAALVALNLEQQKGALAAAEERKEIENNIEARQNLIETQKQNLSVAMTEINNTERLWNELKTLTDENGKVKAGYEKRVNFITKQLSDALGIEIGLNGDIIEGYKNIQSEIDKTITKKKAEIILAQEEAIYAEALQKRQEGYSNLIELQNKLTEATSKYSTAYGRERATIELEIQQLEQAIKQQRDLIDQYNLDIADYEYDYSLMTENTTEALQQLVTNNAVSLQQQNLDTAEGVAKQVEFYTQLVNDYKRLKQEQLNVGNETNAKMYEEQEKANETQLNQLIEQLASLTSTTEEQSPSLIEAWRNLAENNLEAFNDGISDLAPDLQLKIMQMAGIINADISVEEATKNLGHDAGISFTTEFDKKAGQDATKDYMQGAKNGITSERGSLWELLFNTGQRANSNMRAGLGDGSPSVLAKKALIDYFLGADIGAEKQAPKTLNKIEKYGKEMNDVFTEQMSATEFKGIKIPKVREMEKLQSNLNGKVDEKTKMIFTTPTLNIYTQGEVNIREIADEVNKIFGSKY